VRLSALRASRLLLEGAREATGVVRARSARSILCELVGREPSGDGPSHLWLLAPSLSLNPRSLCCPLEGIGGEAGARVCVTADRLALGEDEVSLVDAEPWEPRWSGPFRKAARLPAPPRPLSPALARALEGYELDAGQQLVARLLGLGEGSTPEGDDLLLGLRAAFALREADARALDDALRARARAGTTPVSAEMLLDATAGLYAEAVHDVLAALAGRGALAPALSRLRALGGSSGLAMEWGLHLGLAAAR
jgi:hypothetical protein